MKNNFASTMALSILVMFPMAAESETAEVSWCQHDDPAYVETVRQKEKISNRDAGKIPCHEPVDSQTFPEELVLPMPCGRRMVFRRVDFELEHALDQVEAHIGVIPDSQNTSDNQSAYLAAINGPRSAGVAGAFTRADGERWKSHYYIGKYEVTELQFDLLAAGVFDTASEGSNQRGICSAQETKAAKVRGTRVMPAANMTWLEAMSFAYRYSEWLITNDGRRLEENKKPLLPWYGASPGFVRLPTEIEWEFAVRGGLVDRPSQANRLYKIMGDDGEPRSAKDEEEIAFTAEEKSRGDMVLFYIGRKKPNLLGLYDTLGNSDEMMFGLFQPLRPEALAGQRGGYIVRGGSVQDGPSTIGMGYRQEKPFFNRQGPIRSRVTGFRLLLSAPVFVNQRNEDFDEMASNPEQEIALAQARKKLVTLRGSEYGEQQTKALDELKRLKEQQARELSQLKDTLSADQKRINELETRLEAASIDSSTSTELQKIIRSARAEIDRLNKERASDQSRVTELTQSLAEIQGELEASSARLHDHERTIMRERFAGAVLNFVNYDNYQRRISGMEPIMNDLRQVLNEDPDHPERKEIAVELAATEKALKEFRVTMDAIFDHYVGTVQSLSARNQNDVDAAQRWVDRRYQDQPRSIYKQASDVLRAHIKEAKGSKGAISRLRLAVWKRQMRRA